MFTPPVSMTIDLATLAYHKVKDSTKQKPLPPPGVSAFVPTFNEEWNLRRTVEALLKQTHELSQIYILDDLANKETYSVAKRMARLHPTVQHIRRTKEGKAGNINRIIRDNKQGLIKPGLEDMILVVDGDVVLKEDCVENMLQHYTADTSIITAHGDTRIPKNMLARALHTGENFANNVFAFRKRAQEKRNAIGVICGAVSMYKKSLLEQLPIPDRTKTEDTDYTWLAQENGHRIAFAENAFAEGGTPESTTAYWKRYDRWMSGTYQSLFLHGRDLAKSKSLAYSTLLPSCFEATSYSAVITALPVIASQSPGFAAGILTADLVLTLPWLGLYDKGLVKGIRDLPQIYAFKFFTSVATTYSAVKTTAQYMSGKRRWNNTWKNQSN